MDSGFNARLKFFQNLETAPTNQTNRSTLAVKKVSNKLSPAVKTPPVNSAGPKRAPRPAVNLAGPKMAPPPPPPPPIGPHSSASMASKTQTPAKPKTMSLDDALKQAVNNRKQPARSTFDQTEKTHSFESDCLSLAKETGFTFAAIQYMTTKAPDKTGFDFSQFKAESAAYRNEILNTSVFELFVTPLAQEADEGKLDAVINHVKQQIEQGSIDMSQAFKDVKQALGLTDQQAASKIKLYYDASNESALKTLLKANTKQGEKSSLTVQNLSCELLNEPDSYLSILQGQGVGMMTPFIEAKSLIERLNELLPQLTAEQRAVIQQRITVE
ncbi:hypothetical protein ACFFUP_12280 [Vibrio ostreicida]|uniref:YopN family type III secretion system gatekeeper subunit n=2 Tax=Vibrio ostreicida TaxID=526588 RepID=A0ABT8C0Z9_9VIBR|nr:hypothetical protein [Vibrio ostreicida]MDN3611283.1 hypothetical protein [Vibrio ostreicida]MDN3612613.1 hypothetical protein [Vibrio ostreicida]NPD09227.1 hypothetical protein [Vibrio ostreicida]